MARFRYRVRDKKGRSIDGEMEAVSAQAVSETLGSQGLYPISISKTETLKLSFGKLPERRLRSDELSVFTRQLWSLQKAGLPLLTGLASLKEQAHRPQLKSLVAALMEDLEKGKSLSEAFAAHPRIFRPIYIHMVKAGEASGKLEEVFLQLSDMEKFEKETRDRVRSATLYPTIAFFGIIIAFLLVVTLVIPKFADLFSKFGAQLPLPTRILLAVNHTIHYHWLESGIVLAAVYAAFRFWKATPMGRYQLDFIKLKAPVFGELFMDLQMSRFARVLSDMLKSGVPVLQSIQLVADTMTNKVLETALLEIHKNVNEGKGMAKPMKESRLFAPMVVQMVEVGEQTGRTDELLVYVGEYYQDQANTIIKNLGVLIEPMLLAILGGMILLLAAGVFTPVWDMVNVVR